MCKFIHVRNKIGDTILPTGGVTVAFDVKYEDDGSTTVLAAIARASLRDNFSRRLGRTIAAGRLAKGKCMEMKAATQVPIGEIVQGLAVSASSLIR